ncbi:MAG: hypothetical protein B7C54_09210 [Acidimicrobiales bacterium mtb01]|nr:sulfite exporter TauE/SafE family protein [Actinomycetota bacterium]TEX45278.1 MAG: hypothetical protein B7C54_09210 [Acidimicrobiales bacterium mtb01]
MTGSEIAVMLVAVLVASTAQYTAGFGFSLLSVPIMALALETHDAVIVATWLGLITSGFQAVESRRAVDWPTARRLLIGTLTGIPIGLIVFTQVPESTLRFILGVSVLAATVVLARDFRLTRPGNGPEWIAGTVSGALASSLSTNGPPLVFVLQARRMPIAAFRATLSMVFTVANAASLIGFLVTGELAADISVRSALGIPCLVVGVALGSRLRRRVTEGSARHLVIGLLAVAGLSAVVAAL